MKEVKKAIIVLHISAILYFVIGLFMVFILDDLTITAKFVVLLLVGGMGIFVEIIINGLKRKKFWAWVAGTIVCSLYIPSAFIVFGIIGLVGLLNKKVRCEF